MEWEFLEQGERIFGEVGLVKSWQSCRLDWSTRWQAEGSERCWSDTGTRESEVGMGIGLLVMKACCVAEWK